MEGNTIYHKMVSDTFDVAEIFFNFDRLKDKFEILIWDKDRDLDVNNAFGKTLKRYLDSDSTGEDPYNFSKLQRFYLLNYIGPDRPASLNIVGATSPATLFFTSANKLNYVSNNICFGIDRPFDDKFQPLFKRDFECQKYLYAFRKAYGEGQFHKDFPEIDNYLINESGKACNNYNHLTQRQKDEVDKLDASSIVQYEPISIGSGNTFDILGKPFHKRPHIINWKSDFEIASELYNEGQKPLVLPVDSGNTYEKLNYTTDHWAKENRAPYYDATPFLERHLPIVGDKYPYLTISDFLADTIVRMPYKINSESFFDGNYKSKEEQSYLLPLTETLFRFFSVQDMQGLTKDGSKKMFELIDISGGVKAIIRIPIKKGYVEYSRIYFTESNMPDIENNDGAMLDKKFGMGVLPLATFPENVEKHYRIAMFDKGDQEAVLTCMNGNINVKSKHITRVVKNYEANNICSTESYVIEDNFDCIQANIGNNTKGYIIPKFKPQGGTVKYTFAVDLGTTNTHIEYCTDRARNDIAAFNITRNKHQLHKLHLGPVDKDIESAFTTDFIPDTVGDNDIFSFPMRTVFSERQNIEQGQILTPLADGNIPFLYEKEYTPNYNNIKTDLKWGDNHTKSLEMYLETLFILMRNKVILGNGDLPATKIVWFYPASMTEARVNRFKTFWDDAYKKYFDANASNNVISISESMAPYNYYRTKGARSEVVTIDIGGGTTDVYVVEAHKPRMLLSFRYASNAIFGDGHNWDSDNNGFINIFKKYFEEILEVNKLEELKLALRQIEQQKSSSDIVAFLFSLIGDKVNNNPSLNFLQQLTSNDKLRYVFIVFYASIFYFVAKSMKIEGLKKPLTLAFSGNGSRTLRIVSEKEDMIARFVGLIFDGVYADGKTEQIQVIMEEEPKKATCKGGVIYSHQKEDTLENYETIENIKKILIGNELNVFSKGEFSYTNITSEIKIGIVESVKEFFHFLFDLHKNNNDFLSSKLGADPTIFSKVKEICLNDTTLSQSLLEALYHKQQEVTDDTKVEETLFFYPLVGVLHDLALKISEM